MILDKERLKVGITVEEMARTIGVSTSAYNFYENGKRKIPKKTVEQIAIS